jgi:phytanoyl-CoA hydroxylase
MLSPAQVQSFDTNGYLKGGRILDDAQVDELRDEIERVIRDKDAGGRQPVLLRNFGQPDAPVWQIVNIWNASDAFQRLIESPRIAEEIAQLTRAKELRIWHDQIQYKPPGVGGINIWHQDAPYWPILRPMTQITAWIALDDVDESNGCMSMVPGSHLWGDQIQFLHKIKDFHAVPKEFDGRKVEVKLCPVAKGEVHYHHALTWHGSHANTSNRPRRAIALHYLTEQTRFVAAGQHPMKPFVEVADGEVIRGKHFPLVWKRDT